MTGDTRTQDANGGHDREVEEITRRVLRWGLTIAVALSLVGGTAMLVRHGGDATDYHVFRGEPAELGSVWGVMRTAVQWRSDALIQAGLLVLIVTPIIRVFATMITLARQRDRVYVVLTGLVLTILLYSFAFGGRL